MDKSPYYILHRGKEARLWKGNTPLVTWLDMELTERCNLDCIHCCINLPPNDAGAREKELSTEEIKGILKEAASWGCLKVKFTGGEPLLRSDFEELYLFARRLGLRVLLFTNATLLASRLELLARIPPLERIEVTVYGMKKDTYEAVTRTPGSFKAAWEGIHLLRERKIPFIVKGALLPPNREEIDEFENWAATLPGMDEPPSSSMFFTLRNRRDEGKNEMIRTLRLSPQEGLRELTKRGDAYGTLIRKFIAKFLSPPGYNLFNCGAGVGGGCVDAYGYFYPCVVLKHPATAYDRKRGTLKDAVEKFFPELRKMQAGQAEYLNRCARCFLRGLCEQCPGKSWTENGTLDAPVDYFCELAHVQAQYVGLLHPGERAWEIEGWRERVENFLKSRPMITA